jgi:GxxExxY protein
MDSREVLTAEEKRRKKENRREGFYYGENYCIIAETSVCSTLLKFIAMSENAITERIIGCAIKIHKALGPGLLESAYEECLFYELSKTNLKIERQKALPLIYEAVKLECGYRADFLIEKKVIIEIKALDALDDIHLAQTLTYLKLSHCQIGLLINFNVLKLTNGLKRVINNSYSSAALSEKL